MTHPAREHKEIEKKRRLKKGEPFDPDELSRRLDAYLSEQKKQAERRRKAKEAAAAAARQTNTTTTTTTYVPQVAAAAFARTATPDAMRQVHKLSKPAVKQYMEAPGLEETRPTHGTMNLQKTQALDQLAVEKMTLSNRNQFQWTHEMEEAAEVDAERDVYKPPQRTFESEFSYLKSARRPAGRPRPLSTGNVVWEEDDSDENSKSRHKHLDAKAMKGRNDWAQVDEPVTDSKRTVKALVSPLLRKRDSIWILKSKKEKPSKTEKDDASKQSEAHTSPPDGGKSGKGSFFTRFKRLAN